MTCPDCQSHNTRKLALATDLGYARFQCRSCRRTFNERTGTPFNFLEMPTDIVFQVVLFRLLFKLSLRDLRQLFLIRGYEFSDETVRDWEARFAPLLADQVRRRRQGRVGRCWYVDETFHEMPGPCQALFSCAVTKLVRLRHFLSMLFGPVLLLSVLLIRRLSVVVVSSLAQSPLPSALAFSFTLC
jgi:hypothetical protein